MTLQTLVSYATQVLTIQDVLTDSPVWRANLIHIEDQMDQFEKWMEGFLRALKSYIDAIKKYNTQASALCKCTFFSGLDNALIDTQITGSIVTKFATTLQATIAHRAKMASDLEDVLLNPLQNILKYDLKEFKEVRKQFEKIMDKYEAYINRYSALSKQKESSSLREDTFQMYEQRKLFVQSNASYFHRLISLKGNLENLLVECFSGALGAHLDEIDESANSCGLLRERLPGWKQWLEESKVTCEYQMQRMEKRCNELESVYLQQTKPLRALENYSASTHHQLTMIKSVEPEEDIPLKHGYLNARCVVAGKNARINWVRKWFYIQAGEFGTCSVSSINKEKGCIFLGDRIKLSDSECKMTTETDRRFCFEIIHSKCTFYLQAETEFDMQQWIWAVNYAQRRLPAKIDHSIRLHLLPKKQIMDTTAKNTQTHCSTSNIAFTPSPTVTDDPSELMMEKEPVFPFTTCALTSVMLQTAEVVDSEPTTPVTPINETTATSWSMPWLTSSINVLSNTTSDETDIPSSQEKTPTEPLVIWPTKIESDVPRPNLSRYSNTLEKRHRQLRKLFANVPDHEVVLESFVASLYCESIQDEDNKQAFGYSGSVFVTQDNLWFYSCTLMTFGNMLIIPLKDIKSVRSEESNSSYAAGRMISLETNDNYYNFGLWLEPAKLVSERLKVLINGNNTLQGLYDVIRSMTMEKVQNKNKVPTSHVFTTTTLSTTLTPVTVHSQQQQQSTAGTPPSLSDVAGDSDGNISGDDEQSISRGSPAKGALTAAYKASLAKSSSTPTARVSTPETTTSNSSQPSASNNWPVYLQKPKGPVKCGCTDHLEKKQSDIVLPINPKQLFDILFSSEKDSIWHQLNKTKGYGEPSITGWKKNENDKFERIMKYLMPVSIPMVKAKETEVIESQQILTEKECTCYVVIVSTKTPNMSYADAFIPCIKYCITYESTNSSRLVCSLGVKWLRSIMVKNMVNRAAVKGMTETITGLMPIVQSEVSKLQGGEGKEMLVETSHSLQKEENGTPEHTKSMANELTNHSQKATPLSRMLSFVWILCILMTIYQLYNQYRYESLMNVGMKWKGVYLRDIEDQLLQKDIALGYVNQGIYQQYQEAKIDSTHWNYVWLSKRHRSMANDLAYSREKIGSLRYEMLSLFRILNRLDYQLIENEYWNWVSDKKLYCNSTNTTDMCQAISDEVEK